MLDTLRGTEADEQIAIQDRCWFLPHTPPCFIQLGRYGDLLLLFPAFKLIKDRTGSTPVVIVTTTYANLFEGISYATPYQITGHWYMDMPKARAIAEEKFGSAIIPHWWSAGVPQDEIPQGPKVLQCHGHEWGVDIKKYPDFGTSMWLRAGFTREEMIAAPLVFDRRNPVREEALVRQHVFNDRPLLLYNFTGVSSPFGYVPEMMRLLAPYRQHFNMLDLGQVRAARLFDLLGLYDRAVGLVTIDTSLFHLAPASKVPTILFSVDGWGTSVPRGNCQFNCKYSQVPKHLSDIESIIKSWQGGN